MLIEISKTTANIDLGTSFCGFFNEIDVKTQDLNQYHIIFVEFEIIFRIS